MKKNWGFKHKHNYEVNTCEDDENKIYICTECGNVKLDKPRK
ncbi:MAG: hypothetical protein ACJA2M_000305 [Polaribacter sp.]|jgi:hypothetical protein